MIVTSDICYLQWTTMGDAFAPRCPCTRLRRASIDVVVSGTPTGVVRVVQHLSLSTYTDSPKSGQALNQKCVTSLCFN